MSDVKEYSVKLAFCLFNYFPFGGLQRDFLRIIKECVRRGHDVHVFTMNWEGDREGLTIDIIKPKGLQNHTRRRAFAKTIQPKLKGFDLTIGFNKIPFLDIYYAADTCYQAKAKKERSFWYQLTPRCRQDIAFENAVFAKNSQTEILLISKRQQQEFVHYYQTQNARFHLLPPGITRDRSPPADVLAIRKRKRAEWQIGENELLVLLIGSGFKTKGLDRAILAIAALPDDLKKQTHLYVIGQDQAVSFQRLAQKLNVDSRIQFLGGRNDVAEFLWAADLLIHPAYNENTGTVLLEAVTAGLPVLTTDVCGYADYIKEAQAGIVLPSPFAQSQLNTALHTMLDAPNERASWQKNALTFANNADIYSLPERAVDIIEKLAGAAEKKIPAPIQCVMPDSTHVIERENDLPKLSFDQFMALEGDLYRALEGRKTLRTKLNGQSYFIKQHFGVGWYEIFKNIFQGRLPILSAKNEWVAIKKLQSLQIDTPRIAGFGLRGHNPAYLQSFILTHELKNTVSLEDYCKNWRTAPPSFHFKKNLIQKIAKMTRVMHQNGINHRDFYICHFLLDHTKLDAMQLYLIDLHRAKCRKKTGKRWLIKDLAGLYFSSLDIGLTQRDLLRFMREYRQMTLSLLFNKELKFWLKVKYRGDKLYRKHQ